MNRPLRVCVLGSCNLQHFPIIDYGGIESCVEHLCTGIHSHFSDKIKFCVIVPKIFKKREVTSQFKFNIIEANYVGCSSSGIHPINFALEAKEMIRSSPIRPDIIWSYGDWSAKGLHDLGIPIISTILDSGPWIDGKFIFKENIHYRFASKFLYDLVLQDAATDKTVADIKTNSFWCHTGLDDYEFDFEPNKDGYILWVAGLHWGMGGKGLDTFIELAKRLPEQEFVAYGTGDDGVAAQLRQIAHGMPNLSFRGVLARDESHRTAFKKAKMFAMLTRIPEAFGRTNIEAISKGTPVIGSMYGAVPELVNHPETGFCSNNIDELVSAIKMNKFNNRECFEFARSRYHIKTEIKSLMQYSEKILNRDK